MSKSLGNVYTLRDLEAKDINLLAFRYLVLTSHYRSKLNFTWESLHSAEQALKQLQEFVLRLKSDAKSLSLLSSPRRRGSRPLSNTNSKYITWIPASTGMTKQLEKIKNDFKSAIFDDLNTPKALALVWAFIHEYNKNPEKFSPKEILNLLYDFDQVLGLGLKNIKLEKIPTEIKKLANMREEFRKKKQWADSDRIRDELAAKGWVVEDTEGGAIVRKISKGYT